MLVFIAGGCSHTDQYVWVDEAGDVSSRQESAYLIAPGDMLNVRVWNQEAMSGKVRVRLDGKISLPFVNDVDAAGYPPAALAQQLQGRLKDFIVNPVVHVSLEESKPFSVSVLGEVLRPGMYPLEPGSGVLHALATAGGLTQFAKKDRIFVVRTVPAQKRIRFDYDDVSRGVGRGAQFRLQNGDVLLVE